MLAKGTAAWAHVAKKRRGRSRGRSGKHAYTRFVLLPHFMLNSEAWRSLTPAVVSAYIQLAMRYNGRNNGEISLAVREVARLCHVNKDTAARVLKELEEKGFCRPTTLGAFSRHDRQASEWELTLWPRAGARGKRGTRDFMRSGAGSGDAHDVQLPHFMLRSEAWRSLTPQVVAAYVLLASRYDGTNNGRIPLSVREVARLCHVAPNTAMRALKDLESKGFIVRVTEGGFSRKVRHATEWGLTQWPMKEGEPATDAFARWRSTNVDALGRSAGHGDAAVAGEEKSSVSNGAERGSMK